MRYSSVMDPVSRTVGCSLFKSFFALVRHCLIPCYSSAGRIEGLKVQVSETLVHRGDNVGFSGSAWDKSDSVADVHFRCDCSM